jgi:hypothetical protein
MSEPRTNLRVRVVLALALLFVLGLAGAATRLQPAPAAPQPAARNADPDQAAANIPRAPYSVSGSSTTIGPGGAIKEDDLREREAYWLQRLTYPTGLILPGALADAVRQDARISSGIPAGRVTYNKANSKSPLALNPNAFVSLGPAPLQTDGCYSCYNYGIVSGRATDVQPDPTNPNVAYLATAGGGVWKTTNCCSSSSVWHLTTNIPVVTASGVDAITFDPSNHDTLYVGTGEQNYAIDNQGAYGILKSVDAGNNWTLKGTTVFTPGVLLPGATAYSPQSVGKVQVDPRNSANVLAGTRHGLYVSNDAAETWTGPCFPNSASATQREPITGLILSGTPSSTVVYAAVGDVSAAVNGANAVYSATLPAAGCPATWQLLNNGWPAGTGDGTPSASKPGRIDLAIAPSNPLVLYAQAEDLNTSGLMGVWRTTDGGASWNKQSDATALTGCGFDYGQNWYDQGLAVDPHNPDVVFMDTYDIWKSTDGGVTFQDVTCGYGGGDTIHVDQHGLSFLPGSSTDLLAVNDGGVYVTHNANVISPTLPTWLQMNNTLDTIQFYSGDTTGNFATAANPGANGGAQDNASNVAFWGSPGSVGPVQWQARVGGDGFYSRIEPVLNQRWYQGNNSGHIWLAPNGPFGVFSDVSGGWTSETRSFIMPFEIYKDDCPPTGCTHLIVGSYRVWETTNGGISPSSWYSNSLRLTKGTGSRAYINQLANAPTMSNTAIVGTNDGNVQYGFNLGQGTTLSATWVDVTGGNTLLPNRPILDVWIDPSNPLVGMAAVGGFSATTPTTPGHVFQVTCSTNCASFTWADKTGNLPDIPADSIIANPNYPLQVFVGTEWGLYFTNDFSAATPVWQRFDAGLPHAMIWDLTIDRGHTTLAAWTHGRGAWVWPLPSSPFTPPTVTPTVTGTPPTATPQATASATPVPPTCPVYTVMTGTAALIPGTTDSGNHCDDCATAVQMPFPVKLYDQTFNVGYINSNGSFQFGPPAASYNTACLPDRNQSYSVIAYQADLTTAGTGRGVFTATLGTAPNRQFIVEWRALVFSANALANFEVIFNENEPGGVQVVYGVTPDNGAAEEAGIERGPTGPYTQLSCNAPNLTAGLMAHYMLEPCPPSPTPTVTATPCAITFTDVHPADYFYVPVQYLACHAIVSGYADHTFRPYANTTRSQMVKIVVNAFNVPNHTPANGYTFTDVQPSNPFYSYIEAAAFANIISGYTCGGPGEPCDAQNRPYFRPFANVTRGQLSKIVVTAARLTLENPTDPTFQDVLPNTAFYTYVETAAANGLVSGYSCGGPGEPCGTSNKPYFRQFNNATRGQIAKIVYNALTSGPPAGAR